MTNVPALGLEADRTQDAAVKALLLLLNSQGNNPQVYAAAFVTSMANYTLALKNYRDAINA